MVAVRETFNETYPAISGSVPRARHAVAAFAASAGSFAGERLDAIALAISEAMTNAVVHAYRDGRAGMVRVTVALAAGEMWVLVADDGCGHQTPAERPGLGWGLALIADSADGFEIAERAEGGTEARMRFALEAPI